MDLYSDKIIEHGKNPRHFGEPLRPSDIEYEDDNSVCGDRLRLTIQLNAEGRINAVSWEGEGCLVSVASASILGEEMLGKTLEELRGLGKQELLDMLGIQVNSSRLNCALLSLKVFKGGAYGIVLDEDDE